MKFIIYSKPSCPYCKKIKLVMETARLDHIIYVLDQDFTREEFQNKFGQSATFPQVIMDNLHLGGCVSTIRYLTTNKII